MIMDNVDFTKVLNPEAIEALVRQEMRFIIEDDGGGEAQDQRPKGTVKAAKKILKYFSVPE